MQLTLTVSLLFLQFLQSNFQGKMGCPSRGIEDLLRFESDPATETCPRVSFVATIWPLRSHFGYGKRVAYHRANRERDRAARLCDSGQCFSSGLGKSICGRRRDFSTYAFLHDGDAPEKRRRPMCSIVGLSRNQRARALKPCSCMPLHEEAVSLYDSLEVAQCC